jgi:hypothetical protein
VNRERIFLDCSKANIPMNLSDLLKKTHIDLKSVDVTVLFVGVLDRLLLNESVSFGNDDASFRFILELDPGCRDLLRYIQIVFLNDNVILQRITHPPPPWLDSPMI